MSTTTNTNSASGCFSVIIRRLLCNGTPQTHPNSDHVHVDVVSSEPNIKTRDLCLKPQVKAIHGSKPNVVARLMGLDSLPESTWPNKPDLVTRSRSVNFMDYLVEFDLKPSAKHMHRRVRTSVSFREDRHFLITSPNEIGSKSRQLDLGELVKQKKRPERIKNKENKRDPVVIVKKENRNSDKKKIYKFKDETRKVSRKNVSKANRNRAAKVSSLVSSPPRKNRKSCTTSRKMEPVDCSSSVSSSPVSLLDLCEFDLNEVTPPSEEVDAAKNACNPSPPYYTSILNSEDIFQSRAINKSVEDSSKTEYFTELVAELIRLTGDDIKRSDWKASPVNYDCDIGEICTEIGSELFDLMLKQVVDELIMCGLVVSFHV